jgi:hypothetical protein
MDLPGRGLSNQASQQTTNGNKLNSNYIMGDTYGADYTLYPFIAYCAPLASSIDVAQQPQTRAALKARGSAKTKTRREREREA